MNKFFKNLLLGTQGKYDNYNGSFRENYRKLHNMSQYELEYFLETHYSVKCNTSGTLTSIADYCARNGIRI